MSAFIDAQELKEKIKEEGKLIMRPSSLQQFLGCPSQWFRSSLLNDFQRPAAAANAGTALHKGAEEGYKAKIKTGELPPVSFLTDVVAEEWRKINDETELEFGKNESYDTYEKDLIHGIKEYYKELMPNTNPIAVEKRYTVAIEHPIFESVSGTVDIVLDRGIVDLKHTNSKTNAAKYVLQQSTYTFLRQANDEVCNFNEIHNVVRGKNAERLALAPKVDYARYIINQVLDLTERFWETEDPSLFRGTNTYAYFLCSPQWCGYWSKCPHVEGLR